MPVVRALRRIAVARPPVAATSAAVARVVRRVRRPLQACREAGTLAAVGSLSAATPAGAPAPEATPAMTEAAGGDAGGVPRDGGGPPPLAGGFGMPGGAGAPPPPGTPGLDVLPKRLLFGPHAPPLPPGGGTILARAPDPAPPVAVPEPPVLGLFLCALLAVSMLRRRRARQPAIVLRVHTAGGHGRT